MRWNKFTLKTTAEAEEIVSSTLLELGVEGVQIEDKVPLSEEEKKLMFVDIMPEVLVDDGEAFISFYLDIDQDKDVLMTQIKMELDELRSFLDVGSCEIEESVTEDIDWINNWKKYFKQFYIDDVLIIPSWEEVKAEDKDKLVLHIDPGTAFGTGLHETTQLCIRQLRKYIKSADLILDVGSGSGILSIAALKMGAEYAFGTDLDPCAIRAIEENKLANGISDHMFHVINGNIIDDPDVQEEAGFQKYDIVTANILADVLVELTPVIVQHLRTGGIYITSGIIEEKEADVAKAIQETELEILEVTRQKDWVSITARKL